LKHVGALWSGLAYLSRYNSGWFCHTYDVESTMLEDGTYELVPEPEQGIYEDQVNIAEDLTEAPNQSSEVVDIPDPSLTQGGKPRCKT
jgi:hypothetical protein